MLFIIRLAYIFLKRSRFLTFSCIISIFFANFLCISMFQLSGNARENYENSILEQYGDYQIGLSSKDGKYFKSEDIEQLKKNKQIKRVTGGFYCELYDKEEIYALGVKDDDINRSRYKYSYPVSGNKVVINEYMAERYGVQEDDIFTVKGKIFQIGQVLKNDSFSDNMMCMMLLECNELHILVGDSKDSYNYALLQCKDEKISELSSWLKSLSDNYSVVVVKLEESVQKLIVIFQTMIKILSVIVIFISGLFIVSIFQEYLRKYRRDMAVMRTVGGKKNQISLIFASMSLILSVCGCLLGAVSAIVLDKFLLSALNQRMNFFEGEIVIQWYSLVCITAVVFCSFNIIVFLFFVMGQNILPIQIFMKTDSQLSGKRKRRLSWLRNVIGNQGYLAVKLMIPKLAQNIVIIMIIALITLFSYVGLSSMQLLQDNDTAYWEEVTHGADYLAEIEPEIEPLNLQEIIEYDRILNSSEEIQSYFLIGQFGEGEMESTGKIWSFYATDLDKYISINKEFYGNRVDNDSIKDYIVLSPKTMKYIGYEEGDQIIMRSPCLKEKKKYTVLESAKDFLFSEDVQNQVYIDISNIKEKVGAENLWEVSFYIWGDKEQVESNLEDLQRENEELKWFSYAEKKKLSAKISSQRLTMIKLVIMVLIYVAGIGWLNSARGVLLSRRNEFQILRLIGFKQNGIRKLAWIQVGIYMLCGIVFGILFGQVIVYGIWNQGLMNGELHFYWENVVGIVMFFSIISLFLHKSIKKL